MSDNLRTRIAAAVISTNRCWSCGPDDSACKRCQSTALYVADAVIEALDDMGIIHLSKVRPAVGDDSPFYGVDTEKCYISGCQCGRPKYERQP